MNEIQAGPELDKRITEQVLRRWPCDEWTYVSFGSVRGRRKNCQQHDGCYPRGFYSHYSRSIQAAWEIITEMRKRGYWYNLLNFDVCGKGTLIECSFINDGLDNWTADAETAEMAICLAALKVYGIEAPETAKVKG